MENRLLQEVVSISVLYTIYYFLYEKLYEIHSLLHELHVIRINHNYTSYTQNRFSAILRQFSRNGLKKFLEIMKFS